MNEIAPTLSRTRQQGSALIITILMLTVITLLAVTSLRTSLLEEQIARGGRSQNLAFQSAEAGLVDGRKELETADATDNSRSSRFQALAFASSFSATCGDSDAIVALRGLCVPATADPPVWRTYMKATSTATRGSAALFNGNSAPAFSSSGSSSIAQPSMYLIERLPIVGAGGSLAAGSSSTYYRITSQGVGTTAVTQAMVQESVMVQVKPE